MPHIYIPRREFIQTAGLAILGSCFVPKVVWASSTATAEKRLKLYHMHTGESFNDVFWAEGKFLPESLKALNKLLRDWRTDQVKEISPQLLSLIDQVYTKLDGNKPIHIVSAYRCEKTNASLRKKSKGVARKSKHLTGHAIDFSIPGKRLRDVRNCVLSYGAGGVGYYPAKGFVHADIREKPITW